MIKLALDQGVSKIIIGLGGSVTNDAGMGMAQALGVQFLDAQGQSVAQVVGNCITLFRWIFQAWMCD